MKLWTALLAAVLAMATLDAEAARVGGGKSSGRQSSSVTQRDQASTAPAAPAGQQAGTAAQPGQSRAGAAPAAATSSSRPWGGMLGGLAAGLGLAWLAHTLGFGPAMANVLLVLLLALAAIAVIGWVMRRRAAPALAGGYGPAPADVARAPRQYNPEKVGNDASARPWERNSMAFDAGKHSGVLIGSALSGGPKWGIPAGFDVQGFVTAAKHNFIALQDAWDRSDIPMLRSMMTDEMLAEIRQQLADRERESGGEPNKTDVVMLEAQLLGIEDLGDAYMASLEFSGMIREQPSAGPSPFREVWNMTKPKSGGSGWLVAGVQALQ